jgi:hypothetical protein
MSKNPSLYCKFCPSTIILADQADSVPTALNDGKEVTVLLHPLRAASPDEPLQEQKELYRIKSVMNFENIAVMRQINNVKVTGDFKYLSCADCESGPVGINYNSNPGVYYLSAERVSTTKKEGEVAPDEATLNQIKALMQGMKPNSDASDSADAAPAPQITEQEDEAPAN